MSTNLVEYVENLKPHQKEYLIECVREYTDRKDFHAGLLPFLDASEAARCLLIRNEQLKQVHLGAPSITPETLAREAQTRMRERYIKKIISVFYNGLNLFENQKSGVFNLSDRLLRDEYYKRYGNKFYVTFGPGLSPKGLVELERMSMNRWKVTTSSDLFVKAINWLLDQYAAYD